MIHQNNNTKPSPLLRGNSQSNISTLTSTEALPSKGCKWSKLDFRESLRNPLVVEILPHPETSIGLVYKGACLLQITGAYSKSFKDNSKLSKKAFLLKRLGQFLKRNLK